MPALSLNNCNFFNIYPRAAKLCHFIKMYLETMRHDRSLNPELDIAVATIFAQIWICLSSLTRINLYAFFYTEHSPLVTVAQLFSGQ